MPVLLMTWPEPSQNGFMATPARYEEKPTLVTQDALDQSQERQGAGGLPRGLRGRVLTHRQGV